jgi:hypothetical protein
MGTPVTTSYNALQRRTTRCNTIQRVAANRRAVCNDRRSAANILAALLLLKLGGSVVAEPGATTNIVPLFGAPQPHLRRDWAHPCHIGTGTGRGLCRD